MKFTKEQVLKIIREELAAEAENPFAPSSTEPPAPEGQDFAEELMSLARSMVELGERNGMHIDELEEMVRKALNHASMGSASSLPQGESYE